MHFEGMFRVKPETKLRLNHIDPRTRASTNQRKRPGKRPNISARNSPTSRLSCTHNASIRSWLSFKPN